MYKVILDIDADSILIIGNDRVKIKSYQPKIFEIENLQEFDFDIFPCFNVSVCNHFGVQFSQGDCYVKNRFVKVIKINNETYFLKICIKNANILQKKCKKIAKNGLFFNFYQNGLIEIENQNSLLFCEKFDFTICDANVLELKNGHYALKLFGNENEEKCVLINNNFESVLCFESAIVEETETGFKVLTDLHDIACHGLVEVFEIDEMLEKIDEYSVYLKGSPQNKFNIKVLPIYFLQCVRANDFSQARQCLSSELLSKARNDHLKTYFGNFVDIIIFEEKIYLVYLSESQNSFNNNYFARSVSFNIINDKIVDIS